MVQLKFASYNIHKAVGADGRRDPERILAILHETGADVVALQEADRRLGRRPTSLPHQMIEAHHWQLVPVAVRPDSIGWHGNAMLVRHGIEIVDATPVDLPRIEPRGAIRADLRLGGRLVRVVGMHLDLSGLRRRHQIQSVLSHLAQCSNPAAPTVLMGDLNEWSAQRGCLGAFDRSWQVISPGFSFPSRRPVARLDRIIASAHWAYGASGVHHSALAARGSDHLPVWADLALPEN